MTTLGRLLSALFVSLALALSTAVSWPAPAQAGAAPQCRRTLPSYPVLHPGDRRPAVRTLQCAINDTGLGPVVVDGYYGPQTKKALTPIVMGREGRGPHDYWLEPYFWCQLYGVQLPHRIL